MFKNLYQVVDDHKIGPCFGLLFVRNLALTCFMILKKKASDFIDLLSLKHTLSFKTLLRNLLQLFNIKVTQPAL